MRLSADEIAAIKDCARTHFGAGAVVRLFGSRVRDDLRGGDIDLHVIADSREGATFASELGFKDDLEERIGEQRVDVFLRAPDENETAFERMALASSVVL